MQRRSLVLGLVLAACALGAALGWLALRARPDPPGEVASPEREAAASAERTPAAELAGGPTRPAGDATPSVDEALPSVPPEREAISAAAPPAAAAEQADTAPLRVRVVDQDGVPVTSYRLSVDRVGAALRTLDVESLDGRSVLEVEPATWKVSVGADGYVDPLSGDLQAARTAPVPLPFDELFFTLQRAGVVTGRVVDPRGSAVEGAEVDLRSGHEQELFGQGPARTERSDEHGRFELAVVPGRHEIMARAEDRAPSPPVAVDVAAGESAEVLLQLALGGTLHGEVLADGRPVAGVEVAAFSIDRRQAGEADTDEHGRFEIPHLAAGEYEVVTESAEDGDFAFAHCTIVDGERTHVVLGGTPEGAVLVRGSITASGRALGGFELVTVREGVKLFEGLASTEVGDDGRFEITLAGPGPYLFLSESEPIFFRHVDIPDRREVELALDVPVGRIAGTVRGPDGPIAKAHVTLHARGMPFSAADSAWGRTTDADGRYAFDDLPAGRYTLAADTGGERGLARTVREDVDLAPGASLEVDLGLVSGTALFGRVLDAAGRPVAGASVAVQSEGGTPLLDALTSDAAGRFRSGPLSPGTVRVVASAQERVSPSATVRLVAREGGEVELRVGPAASLTLAANDRDGRPVRATFRLRDGEGYDHAGAFDTAALKRMFTSGLSSSSLVTGPLAPGRYEVSARADDGRSARASVVLEAGDERRVELVLE